MGMVCRVFKFKRVGPNRCPRGTQPLSSKDYKKDSLMVEEILETDRRGPMWSWYISSSGTTQPLLPWLLMLRVASKLSRFENIFIVNKKRLLLHRPCIHPSRAARCNKDK